MIYLPLAKVSFFMGFLAVLWVVIALAMILIILLQKGKGGGLSGAFGGSGGGAGLLGTKTGDFLTWVTITLVVLFLVLGIILGKFLRPQKGTFEDETITPPSAQTEAEVDAAVNDVEAVVDEATDVKPEEAADAAAGAVDPIVVDDSEGATE